MKENVSKLKKGKKRRKKKLRRNSLQNSLEIIQEILHLPSINFLGSKLAAEPVAKFPPLELGEPQNYSISCHGRQLQSNPVGQVF